MRITSSKITKYLIILVVLLHLGILLIPLARIEIFASSYINKTRTLLFVLTMLTAVAAGSVRKMKSQSYFIYVEIGLLAICWIRAFIGDFASGLKWDDTLEKLLPYLYPIMALPLLNLFCTKGWKKESCALFLIVVSTIDSLLKAFMSFYESVSGKILWPNIVVGSMGYRNGLFRINPTPLSILVIPLAFWLFTKTDRRWMKIVCILTIGVDLIYAYVIWQARSALLYKTILLVALFIFQRTTDKKRVIRYLILITAVIIIINLPFFNNFLDSFSESNAEYGGNTTYRKYALEYYVQLFFQKPFWGVGLLDYTQRRSPLGGTLEDVGLIYSIVQLGIPMLAFYLTMFSRSIYVALIKLRNHHEERLLLLSVTLLYILFGINIDTFYMYGLTVPFYIAFVEYFYWETSCETRKLWPHTSVCVPKDKDHSTNLPKLPQPFPVEGDNGIRAEET